jgi:DNA-binding NtrC family response regulator
MHTQHRTILVIDDDTNLRTSLTLVLQRAGYQVLNAGCAFEAIDMLVGKQFDLVFLDVRMPGMDGLTLLAKLNALYPKMPVFILTAYPSYMTAQEASQRGSKGFFIKPVDPNLLLDCVREVFSEPLRASYPEV